MEKCIDALATCQHQQETNVPNWNAFQSAVIFGTTDCRTRPSFCSKTEITPEGGQEGPSYFAGLQARESAKLLAAAPHLRMCDRQAVKPT
jgi:hypothetical protein